MEALEHYKKVNNYDDKKVKEEIEKASALYRKRSEFTDWSFNEESFEKNGILKTYFKNN